ncbi:hypothetical protein [Streptomyces sp. NBC_00893]|uniref:hypothetical protein n=1 Tax=Streptomyces sp. NBC_00893 TaxID=2975862 RepID=UPI00225249E1|nr:hypothetical protein [Streptomyces sp. NBC_00893]MCX4849379.1 hypothetical protein [Streptomyces sp. NBC_00893]
MHTLAQRHNLHPWEIRLALDLPQLTSPENHQLSDPITTDLADLIENMIGKGLNRRQIWQQLFGHHDHVVTYDSLNYCFRTTRRRS